MKTSLEVSVNCGRQEIYIEGLLVYLDISREKCREIISFHSYCKIQQTEQYNTVFFFQFSCSFFFFLIWLLISFVHLTRLTSLMMNKESQILLYDFADKLKVMGNGLDEVPTIIFVLKNDLWIECGRKLVKGGVQLKSVGVWNKIRCRLIERKLIFVNSWRRRGKSHCNKSGLEKELSFLRGSSLILDHQACRHRDKQ